MARKKAISLPNKAPAAISREDIALVRMEFKSLVERTMRDFGAIADHLARLAPPQEDDITRKLKTFSKKDYKNFLEGKKL